MKKIIYLIIITVLSLGFSGCAYRTGEANVDPKFFKSVKSVKEQTYNEIWEVSFVKNGWLVSTCDWMGTKSIEGLEKKAKSRGADAVISVKWEGSDGMRTKYPQCKTGWGWILLWPAWLIPGTSDSTVSGTMIKYTN